MKSRGLMIAGALMLAALYIFAEEDEPFTVTFTLDTLPRALKEKIELFSDGILVTVSRISKDSDFLPEEMSDKAFGGIILNKMRDHFGQREDWRKKDGE